MDNFLAIKGGKPVRKKPFPAWPVYDKKEVEVISKVVLSGKWWRGAYTTGEFDRQKVAGQSTVEKFEKEFARKHTAKYCLAVSSGSAALEIAVRALGIGPGDEVITTPYTFIATTTCLLNNGALPVYVDIEPDTYNINPALIEQAITERTKAIMVVHFAGNLANMEAILKIARKYRLAVIEDAAHSHGVEDKNGMMAGTLGDIGCFSFQAAKNMASGEGGAITTNDKRLFDLCYSLHHYGREEKGLWYEHFRLGWNYRMTEFQAAVLLVQLKRLASQNSRRRKNYKYLVDGLKTVTGLTLLKISPAVKFPNHHLVILKYDAGSFKVSRDEFVNAVNKEGVPCLTGYAFPNYANPFLQKKIFWGGRCPDFYKVHGELLDFGRYKQRCPVAEKACQESVWLEHRLLLGTKKDIEDIVKAFQKVADYYER